MMNIHKINISFNPTIFIKKFLIGNLNVILIFFLILKNHNNLDYMGY